MIGTVTRYGIEWAPLHQLMGCQPQALRPVPEKIQQDWYDYHIERLMLAVPKERRPKGFVSFLHHAKRMSNFLWGNPEGQFYFEFNPNAEEMINRFDEFKWLGIAGCKNSGKSETIAWLCLMFFLISPADSKVLVGSKTIETALGKIWASIDLGWRSACNFFGGEHMMPGEMVSSKAYIRSKGAGRKSGIEVIPGESSSVKKSAEKLQGYKAAGWGGRLMFATDETATMAHAIITTAISNLTGNAGFKGVGGFNPEDEHDPARPLALPYDEETGKESFSLVTVEDIGWRTKLGWCCHFDGTKSPNVIAGRDSNGKYPWRGLYTRENLKDDSEFYTDKSAQYWKMVRGFWPPTGSDHNIYSSQEIRIYNGEERAVWMDVPIPIAGCDPAFTHDGDRAMAAFGLLGTVEHNGKRIKALEVGDLMELAEDVEKEVPKPLQVARAFRDECIRRKIQPSATGYDSTGGGASWGVLLDVEWGAGSLPVCFGGSPSDLPVPALVTATNAEGDTVSAKDMYVNKVSEIWHVGKHFLRSGQLFGLTSKVIAEMVARAFKSVGGKVEVEKKKDMKKRTQKSPDIADSMFVMLHVARERFGFVPAEKSAPLPKKEKPYGDEFPLPNIVPKNQGWGKVIAKFHSLSNYS